MLPKNYDSNQLNSIINSLFGKKASGTLGLKTEVSSWQNQRYCILVLLNGTLVYGSESATQAPNNQEFCKMLGKELKPNLINAALSVAVQRTINPSSVRELIELLIKMKVFTWEEVENFITVKTTLILEKFLSHPGKFQWQETNDFDLSYGEDHHGLRWSAIQKQLNQRQQTWRSYATQIPHMDAIPIVSLEQLKQVNNPQVKEHLKNFIDGKATLNDIADKIEKDPLRVAKNYFNWANDGWVNFVETPIKSQVSSTVIPQKPDVLQATIAPAVSGQFQNSESLPIVLSVDDSPIIQVSIKRALSEQYNVLLADKAADALQILNQQPVKLLLLDLTMPDVDGLQFCKIVRQIPKFKDLPIIMVTARDGFMNKAKGHIAGTTKYLTKPFKPDELREIVGQYISN